MQIKLDFTWCLIIFYLFAQTLILLLTWLLSISGTLSQVGVLLTHAFYETRICFVKCSKARECYISKIGFIVLVLVFIVIEN